MNTINKKLLLLPAMLVFMAVLVSANSVGTQIFFQDNLISTHLTIINGQSTVVIVSAYSVLESSMTIKVDLVDANGNKMNLLNTYITQDNYSKDITLNAGIYPGVGSYTIVSTVVAASGNTSTSVLYLNVLAPTPTNHAPVITSSPVTQVNETKNYIYQVIATDADNDPLTYTLIQSPGWITMSSSGLLAGIAPSVNSDFQYVVTVRVSDGKDFATQTFPITVKDTTIPGDTTPPVITVVSPTANQVFTTSNALFEITTNEDSSGAWAIWDNNNGQAMFLTQVSPRHFIGNVSLSTGSHFVVFYAQDIAGNVGHSASVNFSVNPVITPDTTPPVISITYPTDGAVYTNQVTSMSFTATDANLATCWYSLNGGMNIFQIICNSTITGISSVNGTNTWTIYATDFAGNEANKTVTFTVNTSGGNNAPVINSSPVLSVNELSSYAYQVSATDADGDSLTYTFSGPSWLSMDPLTGLLSGTSPSVNADTGFPVTVVVSDGTTSTTQTYTLTVVDTSNNGGNGGPIGGIPRRINPANNSQDNSFENQLYLNQFATKTATQDQTPTAQKSTGLFSTTFGIILFFLLIALIILVIWILYLLFR